MGNRFSLFVQGTLIVSGTLASSSLKAEPIQENREVLQTWSNQGALSFVDKLFLSETFPKSCWRGFIPLNLPVTAKKNLLRLGMFSSDGGQFSCLSDLLQNSEYQSPLQYQKILMALKLSCETLDSRNQFFAEGILCPKTKEQKNCLQTESTEQGLVNCLSVSVDSIRNELEGLKKLGKALADINPIPKDMKEPEEGLKLLQDLSSLVTPPKPLDVEIIEEPFIAPDIMSLIRPTFGINYLEPETPMVTVKFEDSKKGASNKPDSNTNGPQVTVKQVPPIQPKVVATPKTLTEIRYEKYYKPLPPWAKKVSEMALYALQPTTNFVKEALHCSAFVRQVFQSSFKDIAPYLDQAFFGSSAAGCIPSYAKNCPRLNVSPWMIRPDSTLAMWMDAKRVRTGFEIVQQKKFGGLRPGDVVFTSYGSLNFGHIGIVVINQPIYTANHVDIHPNDPFVIAENSYRSCKWYRVRNRRTGRYSTVMNCPKDNRGIVSVKAFGHITHVGRFGGFSEEKK